MSTHGHQRPGSRSNGRKSRNCGTQTNGEVTPRPVSRPGSRPVSAREKGVQVGTYPDVSVKARVTIANEQKEMFPKIQKPCGEVYLFMRGKKELVQRLTNAFVRDKRVIANYGGCFLGIADNIQRYEGDLYRGLAEQCIIVIQFRDAPHAERWIQSSNMYKQKDFPSPADEVEVFIVPVSYLPNEELHAFQLTEMYGLMVDPGQFQDKYVNQVTKIMNAKRIYHGVVASHQVTRIRNCMIRPDTFVLVNCADSEAKLKDFYDSPEYAKYKDFRQRAVAQSDCCFFTLRPLTSK